jgi:hypothetical protein
VPVDLAVNLVAGTGEDTEALLGAVADGGTLRRRFGAEYEDYRRHVPRWIPRTTVGAEPTQLTEVVPQPAPIG